MSATLSAIMMISEGLYLMVNTFLVVLLTSVAAIWIYVKTMNLEKKRKEFEEEKNAYKTEKATFERKTQEFEQDSEQKRLEIEQCEAELQKKRESWQNEKENLENTIEKMRQENSMAMSMVEAEDMNKDNPLFHPTIPLNMIINYLDARSFLRASAACRSMRSFCLTSKQLRLDGDVLYLEVETNEENNVSMLLKKTIHLDGVEGKKRIVVFDHLKRLPICFYFDITFFDTEVSKENLELVKAFLASFRLSQVDYLFIDSSEMIEWSALIEFLRCLSVPSFESNEVVPSEFHSDLFSLPMESLTISGTMDVLLLKDCVIPTISFNGPHFTINNLELLVEEMLGKTDREQILKWEFECDFDISQFEEFFRPPRFRTVRLIRSEEPSNRPLAVPSKNRSFLIIPTNLRDIFVIQYKARPRRITFVGNKDEAANVIQ